jgi:hypothetical protein
MKKVKLLAVVFGILLGAMQIAGAQTASVNNPLPDFVLRNEEKRDQLERLNRSNREVSDALNKRTVTRRKTDKSEKEREAEKLKTIEEINQKLAPPDSYLKTYADFLNQENNGIARMFPDTNCDKGLVVSVKDLERCKETPLIFGAGSLYSVKLEAIPNNVPLESIMYYISQAEIHYIDNKFVVGNDSTQAIISEIGEASLADVNLKSEAFGFLRDFKPAKTKIKLAQQTAELEKGIAGGGFTYSNSAQVKLNSVYVMRTIAFKDQYGNFWNKDIYVAFQVVGREKDGSVVFIWKKLKEKDAPYLRDK